MLFNRHTNAAILIIILLGSSLLFMTVAEASTAGVRHGRLARRDYHYHRNIDSIFDWTMHDSFLMPSLLLNTNSLMRQRAKRDIFDWMTEEEKQEYISDLEEEAAKRRVVEPSKRLKRQNAKRNLFDWMEAAPTTAASAFMSPKCQVSEDPDTGLIELVLELPGFSRNDVKVKLEQESLLHISGSRREFKNRGLVEFERTFKLDPNADASKLQVSLSAGLLRVKVPRVLPKGGSRSIPVVEASSDGEQQDAGEQLVDDEESSD